MLRRTPLAFPALGLYSWVTTNPRFLLMLEICKDWDWFGFDRQVRSGRWRITEVLQESPGNAGHGVNPC